jgi:hypothetical protein
MFYIEEAEQGERCKTVSIKKASKKQKQPLRCFSPSVRSEMSTAGLQAAVSSIHVNVFHPSTQK